MLKLDIFLSALANGLLTGAVYALIALGLTLIYGVLHIINFAHGSLLMLAMYAVFWLWRLAGIDPYAALPLVIAGSAKSKFVVNASGKVDGSYSTCGMNPPIFGFSKLRAQSLDFPTRDEGR